MITGERVVFLDRDGTIIENYEPDLILSPDQVKLLPAVPTALIRLAGKQFKLVIISNQPAIARGYLDWPTLQKIDQELRYQLANFGVEIAGSFYCPHLPKDNCGCRKPAPGLLHQAAHQFKFDLPSSYMIGDRLLDVQAGMNAGCKAAILVKRNEQTWDQLATAANPLLRANNLLEAAELILQSKPTFDRIEESSL